MVRHVTGQLALMSNDDDDRLHLDDDTKAVGREGVAAAREAITRARLRKACGVETFHDQEKQ